MCIICVMRWFLIDDKIFEWLQTMFDDKSLSLDWANPLPLFGSCIIIMQELSPASYLISTSFKIASKRFATASIVLMWLWWIILNYPQLKKDLKWYRNRTVFEVKFYGTNVLYIAYNWFFKYFKWTKSLIIYWKKK